MKDKSPTVETLARGRYLSLLKEGRWEYVARRRARGAVHIVALTGRGELVLVEQPRQPLHTRTIELPAGVVGDEAAHRRESIAHCALRELLEETGYRGRSVRVLHEGPTAPGMTSERFHIVRIGGLRRVTAGGGVSGEDITVHRVPLAQIRAWLRGQERAGLSVDHRIYAGLYLLR